MEAEFLEEFLEPRQFCELCSILDEGGTWKDVMGACPQKWYTSRDYVKFERETSPSEAFLHDLCSRAVYLKLFVNLLFELRLEKALRLFVKDEAVEIFEQPPASIVLDDRSAELCIALKAEGFPFPEYYWYKTRCGSFEKWDLLTITSEPKLSIKPVAKHLQGHYYCRVQNDCSEKCSRIVEVEVSGDIATFDDTKRRPMPPRIVKQPVCPPVIPAGSSVILQICVEGTEPLTYEWYRNGKILECDSDELKVHRVQPVRDVKELVFTCRVSNGYGQALSDPVKMVIDTKYKKCQFYAKAKKALIIGNSVYSGLTVLKSVENDVKVLTAALERLNFEVTPCLNSTLPEMKANIRNFCESLIPDTYVVFYFAGHGFALKHQSYMLPTDAQDDYRLGHCICAEELHEGLLANEPALCFVMLDMCRKDPDGASDIDDEWKMVKPERPRKNDVVLYATAESLAAYESENHMNGFFMQCLSACIENDGPLSEVVKCVKELLGNHPCLAPAFQFAEEKSTLVDHRQLNDLIQ